MNGLSDLGEGERMRELADLISAASKEAIAQERPLIMPWRRDATAERSSGMLGGDAGCGCGPID
jgi:hypothetical protein